MKRELTEQGNRLTKLTDKNAKQKDEYETRLMQQKTKSEKSFNDLTAERNKLKEQTIS
jgi:hypothetical protein